MDDVRKTAIVQKIAIIIQPGVKIDKFPRKQGILKAFKLLMDSSMKFKPFTS